MKAAYKIIDKLIATASPASLIALDKVLTLGIPFNAPHGFKLKKMDEDSVVIELPNRKLNHNHIGGIHACAIATLGEFCAGMSLLKSFGISKYRLILSDLNVKYTYQGRATLEGVCSTHQINKEQIREALDKDGIFSQTLQTIIRDKNGNDVAIATTTWQLKNWNIVKTKD